MKLDEQTRSSIKRALATSQLQDAHLEVVQFISAQLPRDIIMSTTSTEDAEESDSHSVLQSILVLLMVRFLFEEAGQYNLRWQSIADVPGLDITALLYRGEVVGAAVGLYSSAEHAYLSHMSVTHPSLRVGVGIGHFLCKQQLEKLMQRVDSTRGPIDVVSLSANADANSRGAVAFQRHVLQKFGFQELPDAMSVIQRISDANPKLMLDRVQQQDVTPLRFRQVAVPVMSGDAIE
jgi:hypothetical protein